jgi:alkylation response protein AidB-like acyl-CoA dehydrogenase
VRGSAPVGQSDLDDFRAAAAAWLGEHATEAPPDYGAIILERLEAAGRRWQRVLADAGWTGIHWPVDHGGRGLTPQHQAVWLEEAARAGVPPFINMVSIVLMGGTVLLHGTHRQQDEHLAPTLRGERLWCQLFSEPGAGSDLAALSTRAVADGDSWRISGQKTWCSNGRIADWGILLARTDESAPRHRGISFFLLDMHLPGIEVVPIRQMTGGAEFDEVFLDDVVVPGECLVGPVHGGWAVAMSTLTDERGHIGASAISLGTRLDELLAATAAVSPTSATADRVARDALAGMAVEVRALQQLGHRQGAEASVAASLLKLGITEVGFAMADRRADAAGAAAMLAGDAAEGLVSAPGGRIAGGTSQVQRTIIGELVLGLPKEPRPPA